MINSSERLWHSAKVKGGGGYLENFENIISKPLFRAMLIVGDGQDM